MKQLKWTMVVALALLIVLLGSYVRFVPQSYFAETGEIEVYRVVQNKDGERLEITQGVDRAALSECLPLLQCRRYRTPFAPYAQSKVEYEIDGVCGEESFHIVLGDINFIYESAEKGGYEITRSDAWLKIMELVSSQ